METMNLFSERDDLTRKLSESVRLMARYGREYAEAESAYKVALAQTALRLRDSGMAVTMIQLVIHGTGEVPRLRMQRDIADTMYRTAQESIQSTKLQIRLVEAQIEREWGQAKRA